MEAKEKWVRGELLSYRSRPRRALNHPDELRDDNQYGDDGQECREAPTKSVMP